ncbi:AMP-binding protein [Microvirga terricola]|uniref:Fatty acyl-AMP ligase n=1 Tax=Microvirga terricola TaxID=2719797 RepID=A0ABX0VCL8_9HYPH|nr:AMP-binding protein [Microvirga terricola]NIX77589.1 fatty acyl-AMP ligase [Microvirga terricola]
MYKAHHCTLGQPQAAIDLSHMAGVPLAGDEKTVVEVLRSRAALAPEKSAFFVIESNTVVSEISNGALLEKATTLARRLAAQGVRSGDFVLLALETSSSLVTAFFACLVGSFVPCVVEAPPAGANGGDWAERIATRARLANAKLVLVREDCRDLLTTAGCPAKAIGELPDPADADLHEASETDPVFLQFTSGTTSQPKALLVNHRTLLNNVRGLAQARDWAHSDVVVSWLPLYHDMGLVAMTLTGFTTGMPVALMPSNLFTMNPARWLWALHTFGGTVSAAPNFAYQFVASHAPEHRTRGLDLSRWRSALNAAEFIRKQTVELFISRFEPHGFKREAFVPAYGLAECTVAASISRPSEPLRFDMISRSRLIAAGQAVEVEASDPDALPIACTGPMIPGHDVRVVGSDGNTLPDRVQGQILLHGPSVVGGYYGETKPSNVHDGWLETGDLGYTDKGRIYVTGRIKDLIIRAGANISPYEIEQVAAEIQGVRSGAVGAIGVPDTDKGTENLIVFFETTQKTSDVIETMRKAIRERLSQKLSIAVDHVFDVAPHTLQKTTSGKLQRVKLVQLAQERLKARPASAN